MAVRNGTAEWTDYLARSSNVPSYDANYTLLLWFSLVTAPGNYSWADLFSLRKESADSFYFDELGIFRVGGDYTLYHQTKNNSAREDILGTGLLTVNTWYCAALVRASDTSRTMYLGSLTAALASDANLTAGVGSRAANPAGQLAIAEARSGVVRIGNTKIWTAALTLAELQAEQHVMRPLRADNLAAWLPFLNTGSSRGRDYSGGGDLTTYGTMTDEDNPPVAYGSPVIFLPWVSSSPAGISGTLSATLGALTASASGAVAVQGSLSATLGTMAASASGAVAVKGTTNVTLEEMHHTLAGAVAVKGTTSATLGALTLAAAGAVGSTPITGQANITLGAASLSAAGAVAVNGSVSQTLGGLTLASTGTVLITGQASSTLGAITLSASGMVGFLPVVGSLNVTLDELLAKPSAIGRVAVKGQTSATLGGLTVSASGKVAVKGSLAATLGVLALSAMGVSLAPGLPDAAVYVIPYEDWMYQVERENWEYPVRHEDWVFRMEG